MGITGFNATAVATSVLHKGTNSVQP